MEIRMSRENQQIIRNILNELGLEFNEGYDDSNRPRFQIESDGLTSNVFFNIPKNDRFVFQLVFENGNQDVQFRDQISNQLNYPEGGGQGSGGYLTIYLPNKTYIEIREENIQLIKGIIQEQVRTLKEISLN